MCGISARRVALREINVDSLDSTSTRRRHHYRDRLWSDYYSGHRVDSLARLVALRHHAARVGGSLPGLGSFNTVTPSHIEKGETYFSEKNNVRSAGFEPETKA